MEDYQYRAMVDIISGGYPGEWKDVNPKDDSWHDASPGASYGPLTYQYWFTDSNNGDNNNSSRLTISASDSWTADFDDENNLIITVSTQINSIVRGDIIGNPLAAGNWTRDITISREAGGYVYFSANGDNIGHAHALSGPIDMGTETITIPPGGEVQRGTMYVVSHTTGLPWTEPYTDIMWAGTNFRNPREGKPPEPDWSILDYRPGATWDGGIWQSHNRHAGAANIFNGFSWQEMKTHYGHNYDGELVYDDPPYMRHAGQWYNMRNIGNDHWPDGNPYLKI